MFEVEEDFLFENVIEEKAKAVWHSMISRCNNPNNKSYKYYGLVGVRVCEEWQEFANFLHDVPLIDGYNETLFLNGVLQLDKDMKQQHIPKFMSVYSKETCAWLTRKQNSEIAHPPRKFKATPPGGGTIEHEGVTSFCRLFGLSPSSVYRCLRGEQKKTKCGWSNFKYID